jgi:hypothetical protein
MKTLMSCLLLTGLGMSGVAQTITPSVDDGSRVKSMRIMQTTVSQTQPGGSILMPPRCDQSGNVYLRFYHQQSPLLEPVYKLNTNGEQQVIYSLASDPDFGGKGHGGSEFALDKNGDLYQLASAADGTYIVAFNKDGAIRSKARLTPQIAVSHFAVFGSGKFLVAGTDRETATNLNPHSLFTGVFDTDGNLKQKVVFPEDKAYEDAANRGDNDFFDPLREGGGNYVVERGATEAGSDGNVYVVRWVHPAQVYAVSDTGRIIRTFQVKPELEGRKPAFVHAGGEQLAFHFVGDSDKGDRRAIVTIVGLDGQQRAVYDSTEMGVGLACYSREEKFMFLGSTKDGKLKIEFAGPN